MTIILGVDPGTETTGYAILKKEGRKLFPIDFGCIRTSTKLPLSKRYRIIFDSIERLIQKFNPTAVSIETQFVHKNAQSALKVGMARGVVLVAAERAEIPIYEYTPTKAKKSAVGKGSATKHEVQKMMQLLLSLSAPPSPLDAADALALAVCHANHEGAL